MFCETRTLLAKYQIAGIRELTTTFCEPKTQSTAMSCNHCEALLYHFSDMTGNKLFNNHGGHNQMTLYQSGSLDTVYYGTLFSE